MDISKNQFLTGDIAVFGAARGLRDLRIFETKVYGKKDTAVMRVPYLIPHTHSD